MSKPLNPANLDAAYRRLKLNHRPPKNMLKKVSALLEANRWPRVWNYIFRRGWPYPELLASMERAAPEFRQQQLTEAAAKGRKAAAAKAARNPTYSTAGAASGVVRALARDTEVERLISAYLAAHPLRSAGPLPARKLADWCYRESLTKRAVSSLARSLRKAGKAF